jgi:hypothetical protein
MFTELVWISGGLSVLILVSFPPSSFSLLPSPSSSFFFLSFSLLSLE